jgi:hypothetical protein
MEEQIHREAQQIPRSRGRIHKANTIGKMKRALYAEFEPRPAKRETPIKKRKEIDNLPRTPIEIAAIGGVGFHRHMQKPSTEVFVTSLAEIDRILNEKRSREAREIQEKVPDCYHEIADIFSKINSDVLPPLRGAPDHKIELEEGKEPASLGYYPLYKQTKEELRFAKDYIVQNLAKGFIAPSSAPFNSPILIARKPGSGLRFCVDYRKLNALTKKDRYPIPLIDEILQRVGKAK